MIEQQIGGFHQWACSEDGPDLSFLSDKADRVWELLEATWRASQAARWTPIAAGLPKSGEVVMAFYRNSHGKGRKVVAMYVEPFTLEASADDGEDMAMDYAAATDTYYWPVGWYERIDNWGDFSHILISEGDVTHWMPLMADPQFEQGRLAR